MSDGTPYIPQQPALQAGQNPQAPATGRGYPGTYVQLLGTAAAFKDSADIAPPCYGFQLQASIPISITRPTKNPAVSFGTVYGVPLFPCLVYVRDTSTTESQPPILVTSERQVVRIPNGCQGFRIEVPALNAAQSLYQGEVVGCLYDATLLLDPRNDLSQGAATQQALEVRSASVTNVDISEGTGVPIDFIFYPPRGARHATVHVEPQTIAAGSPNVSLDIDSTESTVGAAGAQTRAQSMLTIPETPIAMTAGDMWRTWLLGPGSGSSPSGPPASGTIVGVYNGCLPSLFRVRISAPSSTAVTINPIVEVHWSD